MRKITLYVFGHKFVWRGFNVVFVLAWVSGVFLAHGIFWKLMAMFNPLYALYKTFYYVLTGVSKWLINS